MADVNRPLNTHSITDCQGEPMKHPHEDPQTDYERMLDRNNIDCGAYACWEPMRAFVADPDGFEHRYCEKHAREFGRDDNTRWLES